MDQTRRQHGSVEDFGEYRRWRENFKAVYLSMTGAEPECFTALKGTDIVVDDAGLESEGARRSSPRRIMTAKETERNQRAR